jgi:DNA-binding NarL/FixJ family response regulator/class 3 adenylate cyclase
VTPTRIGSYTHRMAGLLTGTVTFLFADVEGSTRLVQSVGPSYPAIIADVRRLLRAEIAEHAGIEVDATGDELSAVFEEAHPALRAALAGQARIRDHQWPDTAAVRVRMGLHTGVPQLGEEGYTGLDVIRASRIAAAGHGGQILLSSTCAPFVSEVEIRDLGTHRLQGLPDAERIHQVIADGLPRDFPPLRGTVSQLGDGRRVVLADDSVLLREGVARLLEEAGFEVVAQSGGPEDLLRHVAMHKPDVAVIDIRMPPTHTDEGLRAAREIRERHPGVGVLLLSQYVEPGYAMALLETSAEGVGYLLKDRVSDLEQFGTAVRRVADGGSALDPAVVSELVGRKRRNDPLEQLTAREREVLELMAEGRSNQAIADRMFVTLRAVEKHVTSIFTKLGLPASTDDHRRVLAVLAYLRG